MELWSGVKSLCSFVDAAHKEYTDKNLRLVERGHFKMLMLRITY